MKSSNNIARQTLKQAPLIDESQSLSLQVNYEPLSKISDKMKSNSMSFADILKYLTEETDISTIQEIAIVGGKETPTVYGYRSGNTKPKFPFVKAVNRMLIVEKECYIIQDQFRPSMVDISSINGSLLDEMKDLIREVDEINYHEESEQYRKALDDCHQMRAIIDRYEAEIRAKMR